MEYSARRTDPKSTPDAARVEQLKAEISARLRGVCAQLSNEEFAALVDDIADVNLRYQLRAELPPPVTNERPGRAD